MLYLKQIINNSAKTKLIHVCDTRWIERHDAVITFRELYPFILEYSEAMIHQETGNDRMLVFNYLKNIESSFYCMYHYIL